MNSPVVEFAFLHKNVGSYIRLGIADIAELAANTFSTSMPTAIYKLREPLLLVTSKPTFIYFLLIARSPSLYMVSFSSFIFSIQINTFFYKYHYLKMN